MSLQPSPTSLLISLSTYPDFQTDNYLDSIISNLKSIRKTRREMFELERKDYDCYFEPLIYTLWGFWDLCVLATSDNSEIITKVIQPELEDNYTPEGQISSKLYSGISFKNIGEDLCQISRFSKTDKYPFIGIVNLKFSGKWILPNGQDLVHKFFTYLQDELAKDFKDLAFFPVHTFNTYEISIVVLGENLQSIFDLIFHLREMKVSQISSSGTLKKIKSEYLSEDDSHLFIDSQSHFGARLIKQKEIPKLGSISCWDLAPNVNFNGINAIFEIEAKPGHALDLEQALNEEIPTKAGDQRKMHFQAGLYDFYLNWDYNSDVFKQLFDTLRNKDSKLRKHIRKFKTRFLFDYAPAKELSDNYEVRVDDKYFDLVKINNSLKTIKVSKSLRNQIVKLFYSYQNSLLNRITFCAFIDLYYFVKKLESEIYQIEKHIENTFRIDSGHYRYLTVQYIEKQLGFYVNTYKDSYYLRYVNDRSIVDVQDFLIPHNTQLQTIIGFYDSFVKSIISVLIGPEHGNSIILTFDEHITEVNPISIKLLSNNLFEPGLIFTALSKEVTTICAYINARHEIKGMSGQLRTKIINHFTKKADSKFIFYRELLERFDFVYGITDYLRYKYFFRENFSLFLFYHVGFIMQYPKMYDSTGNFNKHQLFIEVMRLLILNLVIKKNSEKGKKLDYLEEIKNLHIASETKSLWDKFVLEIQGFIDEFEQESNEGLEKSSGIYESLNTSIRHNEKKVNYSFLAGEKSLSDEESFAKEYFDLSYEFMEKIYNKCNHFHGLSRNWMDGQVFQELIKNKIGIKDPYFLLDSQGGTFFIDFNSLKEYSEIRNTIFENLRHKSFLYKSQLYKNILKHEEAEGFKFI